MAGHGSRALGCCLLLYLAGGVGCGRSKALPGKRQGPDRTADAAGAVARRSRPAPGSIRPFVPPPLVEGRLDNGLFVTLIQRRHAPAVWMQLVLDGGRASDADPQVGLASICLDLLAEGPRSLDRRAYVDRLRRLGTAIQFGVGPRHHSAYLTTLRPHLDESLLLWAAVLQRPALRPEDLPRVVNTQRHRLDRARSEGVLAARSLAGRIAFGDAHPDGRLPGHETLGRIGVEDCRRFARERLAPEGARLIVVGDITLPELLDRLAVHLGPWRGKTVALPPADSSPRPGPALTLVDLKHGAGAVIAAFYPTAPPGRGQVAIASRLVASALEGDLGARLDALTYKVNAELLAFAADDLRYFWFETDADSVGRALEALDQGFVDVRPGPVDDARERQVRLDLASPELKQGAQFELLSGLDTGGGLLGFYARPATTGLPPRWAEALPGRLQAVQADALMAARRELASDRVQYLVVGDRQQVLPQLRAFANRVSGGARKLVVIAPDGRVD